MKRVISSNILNKSELTLGEFLSVVPECMVVHVDADDIDRQTYDGRNSIDEELNDRVIDHVIPRKDTFFIRLI